MKELTAQNLKSLLDSRPEKYKAIDVQSDGYSRTALIENLLVGSFENMPNPGPAPKVPKPFSASDLMGVVSAENRVKCIPVLSTLQPLVDSQNVQGTEALAQMCLDAGFVSQSEFDAIIEVLETKIDDPSWPAQVPKPSDLFAEFGADVLPPPDQSEAKETKDGKEYVVTTSKNLIDVALNRAGQTFIVSK